MNNKFSPKRKMTQGGVVAALATTTTLLIFKNFNIPEEFEEHITVTLGFCFGAIFNSIRVFLKHKFNLNL